MGREDFQDLSRAPGKYCKGLSGLWEYQSYLAPSSTYNSAVISVKKPPPNPAIPATQESETGGSESQSQPGQIIESLSREKKRLRPWATAEEHSSFLIGTKPLVTLPVLEKEYRAKPIRAFHSTSQKL